MQNHNDNVDRQREDENENVVKMETLEDSLDSTPSPRSLRSDTGTTDSIMRQLMERENRRDTTLSKDISLGSGEVDSLLVRLIVGDEEDLEEIGMSASPSKEY